MFYVPQNPLRSDREETKQKIHQLHLPPLIPAAWNASAPFAKFLNKAAKS